MMKLYQVFIQRRNGRTPNVPLPDPSFICIQPGKRRVEAWSGAGTAIQFRHESPTVFRHAFFVLAAGSVYQR